ncbi:MAG TPA: dephospho-CoA kinase [Desulfatiglandales bacterium]|nr:dephospho-CoA kinase [Desulfatiglandales bacterium]
MLIVGLTGGIGSGKSAVAEMFREEGAEVIDFDHLARLVVEPGKPAWRDIVDYFGPRILSSDRTLNRSALAEIVFSDEESRKALEGFTHPRIFEKRDALLERIKGKDPLSVVVIDFPLLFELGLRNGLDEVILVYVPREVQIERAANRNNLSREAVEKRLKAQMPIEEKRSLSDYVIDNQGSLTETRAQVQRIMRELRELSKQKEADLPCS